MSINIQLDGKLQKISGQTMTKDKIVEKLGYTPANEATVDANIAELNSNLDILEDALEEHKNNMSDIDASSADDEFVIADPSGNVIAKFDDEGLHTISIEAESFTSKELAVYDDNGNAAFKVDENGITHAAKLELNSGDVDDQLSTLSADMAAHTSKTVEHVNSADRARWDSKSDFSGNYSDLVGAPDIVEDESGEVVYVDESGNIIFKIDSEGAHTTKLELASGDVDDQLADLAADIAAVEAKIPEIPVTGVNGKTGDVELEYSDLKNAPAIEAEENEKSLIITDNNGNIVLKAGHLDEADDKLIGIETTEVTLPGGKVDERISKLTSDLAAHTGDSAAHITDSERNCWNSKSEFSGEFKDLLNSPIEEDNSGELIYADESGHIALKIGKLDENTAGLETTEIMLKGGKVDERIGAITADVSAHKNDTDAHITKEERADWNAKATTKYVDDAVAGIVDSAPETLNTLKELSAALGNDENFAATITTELGRKALAADLVEHEADAVSHITAEERATWNNKSDFDGAYSSLTGAPDIATNEDDNSLLIVDAAGNIVFKAGELSEKTTGIETTSIKAIDAEIGNIYTKSVVDAKLAEKAEAHDHPYLPDTATYAGSASKGGPANSVCNSIKIQLNGGATEDTDQFTFDGSTAKTLNITPSAIDVYTKTEVDAKVAGHKYSLTANASHDNVVVLTGTGGENAVSYSVSHAKTDKAGEYTKVTVNEYGHITDGSKPTEIADLGVTNVYTKTEIDAAVAGVCSEVAAHETKVQEDIAGLKTELSESIESESDSWTLTDKAGNILLKAGELSESTAGVETTYIKAIDAEIGNVYNKTEVDAEIASHEFDITANAEDDSIINLEGTGGKNAVTYKATHADSGVAAGEYTKVTVNAKGHVITASKPTKIADLGITDVYTKTEVDTTLSVYKHDIIANASDDDVVVLTGTGGENEVSYSASHANSGVTAGTYSSITVDAKGHVTGGTNPTTLAGYGLSDDAYTKTEVDVKVADHDTKVQEDLASLKVELSKSIMSEGDSLVVADEAGNIVFKAGKLDETTVGVETTFIKAEEANINNIYNKVEVDAKLAAELEKVRAEIIEPLGVTTTENGGLKVTTDSKAHKVDIDDDIIFVLDCGEGAEY